MFSVQHIQQRLEELKQEYSLLSQKITRLRHDRIIQAGTTVKFQLDKEFEDAEVNREKIVQEIEKLLASQRKTTKDNFENNTSEGNKPGKLPVYATLDGKMYEVEPDCEDISGKARAHLYTLRKVHKANPTVSDGLKESDRIIHKITESGERIPMKDHDPIEEHAVYESQPVATKG